MLIATAAKILEIPLVFDAYQWAVRSPDSHRRFIDDYVRPLPGERILDVGCGTGACRRVLPADVDYLGIDINAAYISHARLAHAGRGNFQVADATGEGFQPDGRFDRAFASGVLHHLPDPEVTALIRNVLGKLRPGGTFTTIDPCFVDGQHPFARFLARHDRGRYVRHADRWVALIAPLGTAAFTIVHDMLRVPYSQVITQITAPEEL